MTNDLGSILGQFLGGSGGGLDMSKLQGLIEPLMNLINSNGGLQNLLSQLQSGGLGEQVQSWLGQGANLAADPSQLAEALGPDKVKAAAEQAGMTAQEFTTDISQMLPGLVDKLSPSGNIPGADQLQGVLGNLPGADQLQGMLGQLLGGGGSSTAQ